jgi:hypothetical protein
MDMIHQQVAGSPAGSTTRPYSGSPVHELLTRKEAAYMLRLQPNTLAAWAVKRRFEKELPPIRLGRLIRYRRSDILAFIERHAAIQDAA